jgi:hypothetical protein
VRYCSDSVGARKAWNHEPRIASDGISAYRTPTRGAKALLLLSP